MKIQQTKPRVNGRLVVTDKEICANYKPIGTGECWNCGHAFHQHDQFRSTATPAQAPQAICDQCSRTLEEGALYEDHSPGIWDEKSKTYIRPSGTVKQGRRPMFKPFGTPQASHSPLPEDDAYSKGWLEGSQYQLSIHSQQPPYVTAETLYKAEKARDTLKLHARRLADALNDIVYGSDPKPRAREALAQCNEGK